LIFFKIFINLNEQYVEHIDMNLQNILFIVFYETDRKTRVLSFLRNNHFHTVYETFN